MRAPPETQRPPTRGDGQAAGSDRQSSAGRHTPDHTLAANRSQATLSEPDLVAELDQARRQLNRIGRERLQQIGVTLEAELRVGGLGVERIQTAGRTYLPDPLGFSALIVPAWRGLPPNIYDGHTNAPLVDLIAFRTDAPWRWWYRVAAPFVCLGDQHLQLGHWHRASVTLHPDPLSFLQAEGRGAFLAEWCEHCLAEPVDGMEVAA